MARNGRSALICASVLALAACERPAAPGPKSAAKDPEEAGKTYHRSPAVIAVRLEAGRPVVSGRAAPEAEVRLATPSGAEALARASADGGWSLQLPALAGPAIYGLSAVSAGRRLQGEGYLLLTPQGEGALLRAGAGAVRLDGAAMGRIGAIDYDAGGQAVVSGASPAGMTTAIYLDRRRVAEGRADAAGRFSIALPQPLSAGPHRIEAAGVRFTAVVDFERSSAAPLESGPMQASLAAGGLRIDWLTPGGGVQTTLLIRDGAAS